MTGKGFVSLTLRPKPPLLSRLFDNFSFRTSMGRSRYAALAKLFVCATLRISLLFDRTCTYSCAKSFVFKTRGGGGTSDRWVAASLVNPPFYAKSSRGCPIQAARFWPLEWGFLFVPRRPASGPTG